MLYAQRKTSNSAIFTDAPLLDNRRLFLLGAVQILIQVTAQSVPFAWSRSLKMLREKIQGSAEIWNKRKGSTISVFCLIPGVNYERLDSIVKEKFAAPLLSPDTP